MSSRTAPGKGASSARSASLAGRPEELGRFLALTGIDPACLRQSAAEPGFLGGVLDFLLQDEPLMMVFAEAEGIAPAAISNARQRLDPAAGRD